MKTEFLKNGANSQPLDDFLGLSPEQVHVLFYSPLEEIQHILNLRDSFDQNLLENVPVVSRVIMLIKLIGEAGEAKATKNGYLPKKFVNELYDFHSFDKFTVPTEEYAPDILALRHAVTSCGWMKKKSGHFSLTKKGKQIFDNEFTPSDYIVLLKYWMRNYNWAFTDSYPKCGIVQQAAVFSLYLLHKKARSPIASEEVVRLFIRAFPMAVEEVPVDPPSLAQTAEHRLGQILRLRFLKRFANYFGFVEYIIDESLPYLDRDLKAKVKTTRLFSEAIKWLLPAEPVFGFH